MNDGDFNQAFASLARRENLPASLTSAEWESVPAEIRQRAFFMSRVTEAEILQRFRQSVDDITAGRKDTSGAIKEISMWLRDTGYRAPEGKEGGLQDLSSVARMQVVLRTNRDMARGHAQWVRKQTAIRAFPAQRLLRVSARMEPRDWETRWALAKAATAGVPGVHPTEKVALLNHPIWAALSRFGQPWPPFDFGSGMGVESVSRSEAKELGFDLKPDTDPMQQPLHKSMNDGLQVTPAILDGDLREHIAKRLGRLAEWDGEKLVFTDPDGTKPYTAARLAEIWARPAPPEFDIMTQRDALARWQGGTVPDRADDRVALRKLFGRIVSDGPPPAALHRAITLSDAAALLLLASVAARRLTIPGNVAGWEFAATLKQALEAAKSGGGWTVLIEAGNAGRAVDISALRPGKPGFVFVGGTEFRISNLTADKARKTIAIELAP